MRDEMRERQREEFHVSTHPSTQAKAKTKAVAGLGLRNISSHTHIPCWVIPLMAA